MLRCKFKLIKNFTAIHIFFCATTKVSVKQV